LAGADNKHVDSADQPRLAGSIAPPFSLRDSPHSSLSLDDLRGGPVVLVFYVADWHPVAAEQLRQLEEVRPMLSERGVVIVGISVDGTWSHHAFAQHLDVGFPLLADDQPAGAVTRAYGVDARDTDRGRRAVFVIDAAGVVRWSAIFPDALNPGVDGILTALAEIAVDG
jgi:peroxiredoxin